MIFERDTQKCHNPTMIGLIILLLVIDDFIFQSYHDKAFSLIFPAYIQSHPFSHDASVISERGEIIWQTKHDISYQQLKKKIMSFLDVIACQEIPYIQVTYLLSYLVTYRVLIIF